MAGGGRASRIGLNFAMRPVHAECGCIVGGTAIRTFLTALCLALLAGPAIAQIGTGINLLDNDKKKTQEEIDRGHAIDDAYKSTMKKVPDQKKATNDPWADVRGASQPPSVQKPGRSSASSKSN
jgi:hypothetical protein